MKFSKFFISALVLIASSVANASIITYQGSNVQNNGITMTLAEARSAWEAALFSFTVDTIDGAVGDGNSGITTTAGNTYSNVGNGSSISIGSNSVLGSSPSIYGNRSSASLISFDVDFASPVNAVGFDVYDNDGGGMQLVLTNADTGVETTFDFNSSSGSSHSEFFGIVFDPTVFVSSLRVGGTDPGGITTWDNFSFGVGQQAVDICVQDPTLPQCSSIQVSEPASIGMLSLLFASLIAGRRVKK
ncbi:hypothetical protein KL866_17825 [Alteromonas sp. ALT199]|uniref:hypothetical protein n=1 Tax=unclassified Alteromonas TaxID=2614992 RepID=UPI00044C3C67|nr:hypothetical protein [Alteromonas sp. ALT199]MBT3136923.1 hypothetical protein [Alteromonas sp. ALT199]